MIIDHVSNYMRYFKDHPGIGIISEIIANPPIHEKGRFDIDGDRIFGVMLAYNSRPKEECLWEAHRKYLDVHVLLEGQERVNVAQVQHMKVTHPYDSEGDYSLFEGDKEQTLDLTTGDLLVLYPNEAHQFTADAQVGSPVKRLVIKLLLD